jgi:hypothetical protein
MLWWLIGVWLASGAVFPAIWLLSITYRWLAASKTGPKGLHVLSGLVGIGIGALILLFVCPFRDSSVTTRDTPSGYAVAQAPMTTAVVAAVSPIQLLLTLSPSPALFSAKPTQADTDIDEWEVRPGLLREPPSLAEAEQIAPIQPGSAGDGASRQTDAVVPQVSAVAALLTTALHPQRGVKRGTPHHDARGPSIPPYVNRSSSRGIWLFAPTGNEGANS